MRARFWIRKQKAEAQKPKQEEEHSLRGALEQVYPPEKKPYNMNVVAIHGLETTSERTWVYERNGIRKKWLEDVDMLPATVPEARIFTYNWNANYYQDGNNEGLAGHAHSLLVHLHDELHCDGEQMKPIIFIASCFGGLVLAKALTKPDSKYMEILKSTVGIVFLATPFCGTGLAKMANLQTTVGSLLRKRSSNSLIRRLHCDDELLKVVREEFLAAMKVDRLYEMPIYYFFERNRTELFRKLIPGPFANAISVIFLRITQRYLVEENSACLSIYYKKGLDASHSLMNKFWGPKDPNYTPVRSIIEEFRNGATRTLENRQEHARKTLYLLPNNQVEVFVGRQNDLKTITNLIYRSVSSRARRKEAITGLEGVGKTQLALEVAYEIRRNNERNNQRNSQGNSQRESQSSDEGTNSGKNQEWSIFWIPGSTYTSYQEGYRQIAGLMGVDPRSENFISVVNTKLWERPGHWLLIIDDVDDIEEGPQGENWRLQTNQLPSSDRGFVLITTGTRGIAQSLCGGNFHYLSPLSEEEATQLLQQPFKGYLAKLLNNPDRAKDLIQFLTLLPLAIKLASEYMVRTETNVTQYLEQWEGRKERMITMLCHGSNGRDLDPTEVRRSREAVAATWLISFARIRKKSPKSEECLREIAFYDEKNIPMDLLRSKCGPDIDTDEVIDVLANYSFVTKNEQSIDIHPLVQLAMRNWLFQQKELNQGAKSAIDNLSNSLPFPTPETKELWRSRLPHVVKALGFQHELTYHLPTWNLLYKTGQAYYLLDNYEKAKEFHERARRLEGIDISNRPNAALNARYQGSFKRAEAEYREAIKQQGKTHPSTLSLEKNLACTFLVQGKYDEARVAYQKAFEAEKDVLGKEHPATISTMDTLAFALKSEGNYQEAKEIYKQVLDLKKRKWGTNSKSNLSTIASMEKLATMHQHQGEYTPAEELLREALGLKMRIFGKEHPSTLASCESLALVFERQGRHRDAEDMCRKTLELKKKVMGPSHPSTKRTEDNMALLATFK